MCKPTLPANCRKGAAASTAASTNLIRRIFLCLGMPILMSSIVHNMWSCVLRGTVYEYVLEFADKPLGKSCKLILWASDAQAAVYAVNSSIARSDPPFSILSNILLICEIHHWQTIAMWIPRTSNTNADLFSHLAPILRLDRTSGQLSDINGK